MREIKFRGKRLDNGEWVTGLVWLKKHKSEKVFISYFPDDDDHEDVVVIDKQTLGQYIGLKDKNGVEVYEGDIVKCSSGCPHEIIFKQKHGGNVFGGMPTFYLSGLNEGYQWVDYEEIIGNIYDNPELLEIKKTDSQAS